MKGKSNKDKEEMKIKQAWKETEDKRCSGWEKKGQRRKWIPKERKKERQK